jgi:hypothetical protein
MFLGRLLQFHKGPSFFLCTSGIRWVVITSLHRVRPSDGFITRIQCCPQPLPFRQAPYSGNTPDQWPYIPLLQFWKNLWVDPLWGWSNVRVWWKTTYTPGIQLKISVNIPCCSSLHVTILTIFVYKSLIFSIFATLREWGICLFSKAHCENWMPSSRAKNFFAFWCALRLHSRTLRILFAFWKDLL